MPSRTPPAISPRQSQSHRPFVAADPPPCQGQRAAPSTSSPCPVNPTSPGVPIAERNPSERAVRRAHETGTALLTWRCPSLCSTHRSSRAAAARLLPATCMIAP